MGLGKSAELSLAIISYGYSFCSQCVRLVLSYIYRKVSYNGENDYYYYYCCYYYSRSSNGSAGAATVVPPPAYMQLFKKKKTEGEKGENKVDVRAGGV